LAIAFVSTSTVGNATCFTGSATVDVVSKYLGATGGAELSDKPGLQPSLTLGCDLGDGFTPYANLWAHMPMDGDWDGKHSAEVDATVGVRKVMGDGYVDASVVYIAIESLKDGDNDTIRPQVEAGHSFDVGYDVTLTPFGRVEYVLPQDGFGEEGFNFHAGSRAVYTTKWNPLGAGKVQVRGAAYGVVQNGHAYDYSDAVLAHGRAGIRIPLFGKAYTEPYARVVAPIAHGQDDPRKLDNMAGIQFGIAF
jgi:hypothetical protein